MSMASVRIQTGDIQPVVVQARKNGPYVVPNTLLMPGDVSLYSMNDSDSHIQLKDDIVVSLCLVPFMKQKLITLRII